MGFLKINTLQVWKYSNPLAVKNSKNTKSLQCEKLLFQ